MFSSSIHSPAEKIISFSFMAVFFDVQIFNSVQFVNSSSYFLSNYNTIQKVVAYAYIIKCFPAVVSKF
jgi:hypothetical protein